MKVKATDLFENHPLPSWICDPKTFAILDVNRAATKLLGYGRTQFLKMSLADIANTLPKKATQKTLAIFSGKKGNTFPVSLAMTSVTVGKKKAWLIVATQAEATKDDEQRRIKEQLSEAMMFTRIGTAELTIESNEVLLSDEFLSIVEESHDAPRILSFPAFVNKYLVPEDRTLIYEKLQEGLVSDEALKRVQAEFRIQTAKGNRKIFEAQGTFRKNGKVLGVFHDITRKRKTEEEAVLKGRQIERILTSITDGFYVLDRSLNFVMANHVFFRVSGLAEQDVIGKNFLELFPHVKNMPLYGHILHALQTGESFSVEHNVYHKPNDYLLVNGYPSAEGLFVYYKDISEIKRSQRVEQENQAMYHNLFEHNPLPMWIYDLDTFAFLDVNDTAVKLYGYSKSEFLAMNILDIRPPDDVDRVKKAIFDSDYTFTQTSGWQHKRKDGSIIRVDVYSHSIDFRGKRARIVVANDITKRLQAEEENKRLALIASRTNNAVIFTNKHGLITWVNEGFERMTEYKFAEVVNRKPGEFLQGKETSEQSVAFMKECLAESKGFRTELLNYTKSGKKYWLDLEVMPITDYNGEVTGYMAIESDITTLKMAMQEMFKSQSQLQTILDHAPMMVYMKDSRGRYVFSNKSFQRLLPRKIKDGSKAHDFFSKELADESVAKDKAIFDSGQTIEFPYNIGDQQFLEVKFPIRDSEGSIYAIGGMSLDVTERNKMIQRITESEQRFRDMADNAPVLIWITDAERQDIYFNKGALQFFGCDLNAALERGWTTFLHPGDIERCRREYEEAFNKRESFVMEYRLRRFDNEYRWFVDTETPRYQGDGIFTGYIGTSMDIHERKLAEQSLRESETRYRSIVNDQLDLLCRVIEGGKLTFVNNAFSKMFGIPTEEITGRQFVDFLPKKERAPMLALYDKIFKNASTPESIQQQIQTSDGQWRWIEWFTIPLRDEGGHIYELQLIGHDITERKQLELEQARLDLIVRESYNEIYLFNSETFKFEFANASALRNLGYTLDELKAMRFCDLFSFPDEMALRAMLSPESTRLHGNRLQLQIKHHRKDGTQYDVDIVIQMLEKDRSFVAIATDITQKLKTEKKLLATILEKETLIKEIHHRVKNNLQLISSIIYIKMKSLQEPEAKHFLESTRQKIRSIALIHERLLQSEELDQVDISDYLGRLVYDLQVTNSTPDLKLEFKTSIQENIMDLDSAIYCGLIVNELVTNAIKHAFKGRNQGTIEITFRKEEEKFFLSVGDNGVTMPANVTPGDSSSFGMHLLQIFIRQLGGTFEIIREKGTIFHMRF